MNNSSEKKEKKKTIAISNSNLSKLSTDQIINQAFKFHLQGNISEAAKLYRFIIGQGHKDPRVLSNYGLILRDLGQLNEAESLTRKAIKINPNFEDAYYNLGNLLKDLGKLQEAELLLRKAIKIKPNYSEAYSNLGLILQDLGKLKEAELSLREAIKIKPYIAAVHYNLGNVLKELGKLQEAELFYRKAIDIKPDLAVAYSNLGNVLKELGKLQEAELFLRKAIKHNPNFAQAFFNLSIIELLKGDYKNGLENYEFRFKTNQPPFIHGKTKIERTNSQKPQKGEMLLVVAEQGLGDTLQFMRYIPYLRNQGLKISFCAQEKLHSLIKSSGIDQNPFATAEAREVSEGKWIPLLSLPRYLGINPKNPIISEPYIFSTNKLKNKWENILSQERGPIIAINWKGNPNAEKIYHIGRSLSLETFSGLARNNNFKFLSLQKGFGSEQLDYCSFKNKFVGCQTKIDATWDFLETAAIIYNCDLIITCDTSIAHLAGGMGKTTWTLLKNSPDWRWGIESESTFWYPSMRLFRQKERNNWQEVMERVSINIKKEIEAKV